MSIMEDKQKVSDMAFRNDAANTILALKNENMKLKEQYGRARSTVSKTPGKIKGLQGLNTGLGKQFSKGTIQDLLE